MTLTVAELIDQIRHTLRAEPPSALGALGIINEAGSTLLTLHGWKFMEYVADLDIVAGQTWIDLPTDFQELIAYEAVSPFNVLRPTSMAHLLRMRATTPSPAAWGYYFYIGNERPSGATPTRKRMELSWSQATSLAAAFTIQYRAGWTAVAGDATYVPVPDFIAPLMRRLTRAVARGYGEEDEGAMGQRLNEIMSGPEFTGAVVTDAMVQPSFGQRRGGALQMLSKYEEASPYTIADP